MATFNYTFRNNGFGEYNDDLFDHLFELTNTEYEIRFVPSPKTNFWRFGVRFSKTENIKFYHPSGRYIEPGFSKFIDIHLGVGEFDRNIARKWSFPSRITLTQYNLFKPLPTDVIQGFESYRPYGKVDWNIKYVAEDKSLYISYEAEGCEAFAKSYPFDDEYKYFKIFAWSDETEFEIECVIKQKEILTNAIGRLIVLGNPGAGKTSLIGRLINDSLQPIIDLTHGIDIKKWEVDLKNEVKVSLNVWDFGGQEMYNSTANIFLTNHAIYLLAIDSRVDDYDITIQNWLNQIQIFADGAPTFVILNKSDLRQYDLNRRELMQKFPFIVNFFSTSCLTSSGISELRNAIITESTSVFQNPVIPAIWNEINKELTKISKPYITFDEFKNIYKKHGISESTSLDIIKYFSEIGNYYLIDAPPQPVIILNLGWLLEGINKILGERSEGGVLLIDSFSRKDKVFPLVTFRIILNIMVKAELAFPIDNSYSQFIMPAFLRLEEPRIKETFTLTDCLNFYYLYSFLPKNLFHRFIGKTYHFANPSYMWYNGVILKNEKNLALVKCDTLNRRIDIQINGPRRTRKQLLEMIRYEFSRLHKNFHSIEVQEMIPLPYNPDVLLSFQELLIMNENKINFIPKVVGRTTISVNINELLNDIVGDNYDSEPINIFISYSLKDLNWKNELVTHLSVLQNQGLIRLRDEPQSFIESEWQIEYEKKIHDADILLVLVSADLIGSSSENEKFLKLVFEVNETGRAKVIPILIRDAAWDFTPIGKLKSLPSDGRSIADARNKDAAWRGVVSEINRIIAELKGEVKETDNLLIKKIKLTNIRCFEDIEIEIEDENRIGMFALLLGENGLGKTTILRSIAIGLANESDAAGLLSRISGDLLSINKNEGEILITLLSVKDKKTFTILTELKRDQSEQILLSKIFSANFPENRLFICGYGAGRTRFGTDNVDTFTIPNATSTLFNYDASLQNPELSLRRIQSKGISIDSILRRVDQILMLESGSTVLDSSGLKIQGPWGEFMPIGSLGDGYKATLGWISDLLGWTLLFNENMLSGNICGIVLIDELEQHLHPRWQRIIIKELKEQFPKIQFIISSHTPFLASGVADFKDAFMFSIERETPHSEISARKISNSIIEGKNINSVLSKAFGLYSSLSPKYIGLLERFTELASKQNISDDEKIEMNDISNQMDLRVQSVVNEDIKKKISKYL